MAMENRANLENAVHDLYKRCTKYDFLCICTRFHIGFPDIAYVCTQEIG